MCVCVCIDSALSAPLNVTIRELEVNTAIVTWEILEGDPVIGFAITQQKKDVRMLRYIQEVNTTTRSCALWDLEEDTEYIVHVQSISMGGSSPPSDPVSFRTPRESEKLASTVSDQVNREEMDQVVQLSVFPLSRPGEQRDGPGSSAQCVSSLQTR
ncbi:fibronectin type III domain-containing protein 5 isoform X3 [Salmo salar]|uniref:Fibronectin type III domain-containing protein 5 isoform X3 n=1 Tax=Salmo salar TaxID=8030 RepID=A0ABM3CWS3_SALSA|nr:fibronectin type III domain-containing protein 5-like isoform X3 [Salmo salar]